MSEDGFKVEFSESVYRLLAGMALERGQTIADVLRDEVSRGAWLDDELRQGHRVLIDRGHGQISSLTFAHEDRLNLAGRPGVNLPARASTYVPEESE
jgi:hypothetical protein